jgi:hypothetical protein
MKKFYVVLILIILFSSKYYSQDTVGLPCSPWINGSINTPNSNISLIVILVEFQDVFHNPNFTLTDFNKLLFSSGEYVSTSTNNVRLIFSEQLI